MKSWIQIIIDLTTNIAFLVSMWLNQLDITIFVFVFFSHSFCNVPLDLVSCDFSFSCHSIILLFRFSPQTNEKPKFKILFHRVSSWKGKLRKQANERTNQYRLGEIPFQFVSIVIIIILNGEHARQIIRLVVTIELQNGTAFLNKCSNK